MYPSDLKDEEWDHIRHHFEYWNGYGHRAIHTRRSLINGILYVTKNGCQWRMLPSDFPPWQTVYGYFWRLSQTGVWEKVLAELVEIRRLKSGRDEHPILLIIDAQRVKNVGKGKERDVDGRKKIKGRKRQNCR